MRELYRMNGKQEYSYPGEHLALGSECDEFVYMLHPLRTHSIAVSQFTDINKVSCTKDSREGELLQSIIWLDLMYCILLFHITHEMNARETSTKFASLLLLGMRFVYRIYQCFNSID